jgi:hypothetical protein
MEASMLNLVFRYSHPLDWLNASGWWSPRVPSVQSSEHRNDVEGIHRAFQRAYRRFAQAHPAWVNRRFDADFLRRATVLRQAQRALRCRQTGGCAIFLPTGTRLALAWDHEFGQLAPDAVRTRQLAELTPVANRFLGLFESELQQLAAEQ